MDVIDFLNFVDVFIDVQNKIHKSQNRNPLS